MIVMVFIGLIGGLCRVALNGVTMDVDLLLWYGPSLQTPAPVETAEIIGATQEMTLGFNLYVAA
jgi:hypothetical protein